MGCPDATALMGGPRAAFYFRVTRADWHGSAGRPPYFNPDFYAENSITIVTFKLKML